MKIAVGLSGGVDSSVAAFILKSQGHDITGIRMNLRPEIQDPDAKKVAEHLNIPFYEIDMSDLYDQKVVSYIRSEYSGGRTPNPCVICNKFLKFGFFLERAHSLGLNFDLFSTGHYAIIGKNPENGRYLLKKGLYSEKDQAYFLSMLTQDQLSGIVFPLGEKRKEDVRKIAAEAGLFTSGKKESQDLCSGDYREFVKDFTDKGNFITSNGEILGTHKGIVNYTIGQRRGLGISSSSEPYYVTEIDPAENTVTLGYDDELLNTGMEIHKTNWIQVEEPTVPLSGSVKIRYRDNGVKADIITKDKNNVYTIIFSRKRRAVTPGQLAVLYDGDTVIGSGIIKKGLK